MIIKRNALNRGTAVWLGENRVRFVWACGCSRVDRMLYPGERPYNASVVAKLVKIWRTNGVVLEQCKVHPEHYERLSPLQRLNDNNPL